MSGADPFEIALQPIKGALRDSALQASELTEDHLFREAVVKRLAETFIVEMRTAFPDQLVALRGHLTSPYSPIQRSLSADWTPPSAPKKRTARA